MQVLKIYFLRISAHSTGCGSVIVPRRPRYVTVPYITGRGCVTVPANPAYYSTTVVQAADTGTVTLPHHV